MPKTSRCNGCDTEITHKPSRVRHYCSQRCFHQNQHKKWTPELREELRVLAPTHRVGTIARLLGLDPTTVERELDRQNLIPVASYVWTDANDRALLQMAPVRLSYAEIAHELGCTADAVAQRLCLLRKRARAQRNL